MTHLVEGCSWQSLVLEMSAALVDGLQTGSGLNKQRAVVILLDNPTLEDPEAHRCLPSLLCTPMFVFPNIHNCPLHAGN